MRHRSRIANLPERMAAGAYILSSGLTKLQADKESAGTIHEMATGTYPVLEQVPPEGFVRGLGLTECAIGSALLFPVIGDGLAGLSLTALAGSLVGIYAKTPGLRQEGGVRPTRQGTAFAKDIWLLGIGLSLMGHSVGARRQSRKAAKLTSQLAELRADRTAELRAARLAERRGARLAERRGARLAERRGARLAERRSSAAAARIARAAVVAKAAKDAAAVLRSSPALSIHPSRH